MKRRNLASFIIVALLTVPALADSLVITSATGGPGLKSENIKILKVEGDKIFFRTSGNDTSREIGKVYQVTADDEPNLNAAEAAYAKEEWAKAVEAYQKTLRSSGKDWVKDWSALRLIVAAGKADRFDAATAAYVQLVTKDPAAAVKVKPAVPKEKSALLDAAESEVKKGLQNSKLNESQKEALNAYLLEIYLAKGDTKAAGEAAAKVGGAGAAAGGADGAAGGGAENTVAAAARVTGKLAGSKLALSEKKYEKVVKDLEESRELFVEPADQAEALFLLAEAKSALAGSDEQKLKDAALEYMRVVAHFKDAPDAPHVAESLFKTAQILEKLKDAKTAQDTYQQVALQYPNSSFAAQAKESAERIQKALEQ